MDTNAQHAEQMIRCQSRLRAYLRSLIPDWNQADDVLQEVNLTIWNKISEFEAGTNFDAWAIKIAYFQVLAHRQRFARDRHAFDSELVANLAERLGPRDDSIENRLVALRACISELSSTQRDLLHHRYGMNATIDAIAAHVNKTATSVRVTLHRIRLALLKCTKGKMEAAQS